MSIRVRAMYDICRTVSAGTTNNENFVRRKADDCVIQFRWMDHIDSIDSQIDARTSYTFGFFCVVETESIWLQIDFFFSAFLHLQIVR